MLKQKFKNLIKMSRSNDKGLTLIELIVAVAVLSIVAAMLVASFTNAMEDQRMRADMSTLNNIDNSLKQILVYDDAFEEIKDYVYDDNKIHLVFYVTNDSNGGKSFVKLEDTTLNGDTILLSGACDTLYEYLTEYVGEEIQLKSSAYKKGTYIVRVAFNGALVSGIREYTITNDSFEITNSGDENLYQHD